MNKKLVTFLKAIGPGFIMASVVLGPGSITVSSRIGQVYGYELMWIIVLAGIAMAMYSTMAARFGVSQDKSMLQVIADNYGRWFAALIGVSCFLMAASFEFGNNLGVATAMQTITGISEIVWPFLFTGAAIILIFFAKNLYSILEKLMMVLVMSMIAAFLANLIFAKPNLIHAAEGFVPSIPKGSLDDMSAIIATTFCLHAALYQAYLVQNKGWKAKDLRTGTRDTIAGTATLAGISMLIIITSAAALHSKEGITIATAGDMAIQLEALFGVSAKYVFSLGLWAAAFSSLTVNAVIGGGLLADGLGLGRTMQEKWPRIFTVLIMLVGMTIAVFFRGNIVYALVLAQAATLFAVPAVAIGLFITLNNKKIMQTYANNRIQNYIAVFGFVLIMIVVYFKYHRLIVDIGKAF